MASAPHTAPKDSADLPDRPAGPCVLVVDDEEGMRSFLSRTLILRGWDVETAGSAEEDECKLAERHFDLVILDVALPGRSGLEWLTDLKSNNYVGDVILITAPTALAARLAEESRLTLAGFARGNRLVIYTHGDYLTGDSAPAPAPGTTAAPALN